MRFIKHGFQIIVLFLFLLVSGCQATPKIETPTPEATPETAVPNDAILPYRDPTLPTGQRVEDLLARMTQAEKIGQMTLVEKDSISNDDITTMGIGALLSGGGGAPPINTPTQWVAMVTEFQEYASQSRLGIPLLYGVDAVHGHNNLYGATIFPHNIGLGATRNPDLLQAIGAATAKEMVATGIYWDYAPVLAVVQDARWGRTYEAYGENTEMVSELAVAYMIGLQGESLNDPLTVLATPKHYIADGGTVWGTSKNGTYEIDQGDTQIDEATLRAVHLPPYEAAIAAGAQNIMVSYSSWNGRKLHDHEYLLTTVLKEELGFTGFLVSDWKAIDQISRNYYEAVVQAINAGVDMNMVPTNYKIFIDALTAAVENGDVAQARIDDAVRRILTVKFDLGLFETALPDPNYLDFIGSPDHRELARQAVRESLVLLQNNNTALPIGNDAELIFIAGTAADDVGTQSGGWTIEWQGRVGNITPGTSIRKGIETAVSPTTQVQFNRFGKYDRVVDAAGNPAIADIGIVVVGEKPYAEGVGDSNDLSLSETDIALIERVSERSEKTVVILLSGRPLIITDQLDMADAWVAAWLPGSEGQGVADVLLGAYPFTGILPLTWPRSMDQFPQAQMTEQPLFPFGYGLTTP